MELPKYTSQYIGGMNKDFSTNNYPNTCYLDAKNFRIITSDSSGLSDTSLSTPKGNSLSFTIPDAGTFLGYTILRDFLIIFVKAVGELSPDRIYKLHLSTLKTAGAITINNSYYWGDLTTYTMHLVYKGYLGFDINYPIKVVGNYENANTQKVYWVDGLNTLKHLNTIYNATYNDLETLDAELLEILPNHNYGTYSITENIGGRLKAGRIQYSYQLYSVSGTETLFAPPSNLYNLTTYETADRNDFGGNDIETIVNKSLTITITLEASIETVFNRIRLVALEYELYGDVPTIRILSEQPLVSNIVSFTDIGSTIGELVLEEFQVIKADFIPKTLASKNNYLFAGNITEEYFDIDDLVYELDPTNTFFDSRAYRWRYIAPDTVECVINADMDTEVIIDSGTGPDYTLVNEDNNCINTYNNIENDTNATRDHIFKYKQIDGAVIPTVAELGGEGRIISYTFSITTIPAASIFSIPGGEVYTLCPSVTYPGYSSPANILDYVGYQRDEVYRFGIVWYDLKGRPSYTKWIGDIRMPNMGEELSAGNYSNYYEICEADGSPLLNMNVNVLGVEFTINWDNIDNDYPGLISLLSGYQIVRMPRRENDTTIKAQGLIVPTHHPITATGEINDTDYSSFNITSATDYENNVVTPLEDFWGAPFTGNNSTLDKTLVELLSPEIAISKNITIDNTNDFLEVCGYLSNILNTSGTFGTEIEHSRTGQIISTYNQTPTLISEHRKTISDGFISYPEDHGLPSHIIDTTAYTARGYDDNIASSSPAMTYKGTSLVTKISSVYTNVTSGGGAGTEEAMYGRYRKYMGYSLYGGATYTERSYNSYIKASDFTTVSVGGSTSLEVYNGDTYIGPFSFLKLFIDIDGEYPTYSGQSLVTFPVESKINLYFRLDKINKYITGIHGTNNHRLAELQAIGVSQYPNIYPEVGDLYRYNSAYSTEDISKIYLSKPFDFRSTNVKDVLITNSEPKFNGEYIDSWLKFKYNNYLELEGEQGALTRLINNNDKVVAFQDRGISILSIADREVIQTQNTAQLAVGTGGILSRYDYITKRNGTSIYEAITPSEGGIYFYDNYNNGIYRITDTLEALSDTKGLKAYYESTPYTSLVTAYNKRNREVLFSPSTTDTLCFSGYIDAFSGFYTFKESGNYISNYITFDKYLLSSTDSNTFYLHDIGNYNEYYGETQTSSLTLIVNPNKTQPMSFHVVEWLTDVTTAGVDDLAITFDTLEITNTHQDTDPITLAGNDDLKRRFRTWRLNIFRDKDDGGRIRDSYIKAIFKWTQDANKKLVVHPITFSILPTKIR